MKRYIGILCLIFLMLSGCGEIVELEPEPTPKDEKVEIEEKENYEHFEEKEEKTENTQQEKSDTIKDENAAAINTVHGYLDGYLYDDNVFVTSGEGALVIENRENRAKQYVCNRPGCLHNTKECGARTIGASNVLLTMDGNHIAYLGTSEDTGYNSAFYMIDVDGNNLKEIENWDEYDYVNAVQRILVNHHLYFALELQKQKTSEEGYIEVEKSELQFYDFDMMEGKLKQLGQFDAGYGAWDTALMYDRGNFVFSYMKQGKRIEDLGITQNEYFERFDYYFERRKEDLQIRQYVVLFDEENKEIRSVVMPDETAFYYIEAFQDNVIYYRDETNEMYCYDIGNGKSEKWNPELELNEFQIMECGPFILLKDIDNKRYCTAYVILPGGEIKKMKQEVEEVPYVLEESEKGVWIGWGENPAIGDSGWLKEEFICFEDFIGMFAEGGNEEQSESGKADGNIVENAVSKSMEEQIRAKYPDKTVLVWVYNDALVTIPDHVNQKLNELLVNAGKDYVIVLLQKKQAMFEMQINGQIASGNAPDLITAGIGANGTSQGTYQAYQNGWLEDLTDRLQADDENQLWNSIPEPLWAASRVEGKYLGVSTYLPVSSELAYYVNEDYMKELGISEEELQNCAITDLEPYLKLVDTENYVALDNQNSVVPGFDPVVEVYGNQSCAFVVSNKTEKGKAENLFENEEVKHYCEAMSDYRKNGYLYKKQDSRKNFLIYNAGIDEFSSVRDDWVIQEIRKRYPQAGNIIKIPYQYCSLTTQFNSITGICAASGQKDAAYDALSTIMGNRAFSDLLLYGTEENDYTLTEEGKALTDGREGINSMYFGNTLLSTPTIYEPDNKYELYAEILTSMRRSSVLGQYVELTERKDIIEQINRIVEEYDGLFDGTLDDVPEALRELNSRLKEAGIDEVLEEINRQINE